MSKERAVVCDKTRLRLDRRNMLRDRRVDERWWFYEWESGLYVVHRPMPGQTASALIPWAKVRDYARAMGMQGDRRR